MSFILNQGRSVGWSVRIRREHSTHTQYMVMTTMGGSARWLCESTLMRCLAPDAASPLGSLDLVSSIIVGNSAIDSMLPSVEY